MKLMPNYLFMGMAGFNNGHKNHSSHNTEQYHHGKEKNKEEEEKAVEGQS